MWRWGLTLGWLAACTQFVEQTATPDGGDSETSLPDAASVPGLDGSSPPVEAGARDAEASETTPDVAPPPPPPVEKLVTGLGNVRAVALEDAPEPRMVFLSSSDGLRICPVNDCATSSLVASKSDDLVAPIAFAAGKVYFTRRYSPFLGLPFYYHRVLEVAPDGSSEVQRIETKSVGARIAVGTNVFVPHSKAAGDNVFRNQISRIDADGTVTEQFGVTQGGEVPPRVEARGSEWAAAVSSQIRRGNATDSTVLGSVTNPVALALTDDAVFVASNAAVHRCAGDGCVSVQPAIPDGAFGPLAILAGRMLLVHGSEGESQLYTCELTTPLACVPYQGLDLVRITDVLVAGGRWYVVGTEPGDAATTWGVRRLNFAP